MIEITVLQTTIKSFANRTTVVSNDKWQVIRDSIIFPYLEGCFENNLLTVDDKTEILYILECPNSDNYLILCIRELGDEKKAS